MRQASRSAFKLSPQPGTRTDSCARHDYHRSQHFSRPRRIATSGGPPYRIAAILRRASGSRVSAGEKRSPRAGNPTLRDTLPCRWDRVCAIIFARPSVSRLNPEAKPWPTNFFLDCREGPHGRLSRGGVLNSRGSASLSVQPEGQGRSEAPEVAWCSDILRRGGRDVKPRGPARLDSHTSSESYSMSRPSLCTESETDPIEV